MLPIAQVLGRHFSAASSKPKLAHSTSSAAAFAVAQFEHRLSSQPSPMVSLAMTVPAGTKYSVDTKDSGTVAAYYKHSILQVLFDRKGAVLSFIYLFIWLMILGDQKRIKNCLGKKGRFTPVSY